MLKHAVAFIFLLLLISCNEPGSFISDGGNAAEDSLAIEIREVNKDTIFNGFAVAIVNEQGILYQKGFGFADVAGRKKYTDSTIQNIASISKTFVGVALLKAQELGKLNLDDPINKYLPFKVYNPNFPKDEITLRHLATHTSGIIDNEFYLTKDYYLKPGQNLNGLPLTFDSSQVFNPADSIVPLETFLENMLTDKDKWNTKDMYLNRKPGELYEYSNIGTTLAAFVLEQATGEKFDRFTENHILKPLHMNASGWHFEDVKMEDHSVLYGMQKEPLPFYRMISYPDGNFITSVNDLGLYLSELIKGYNGRGNILNKENYKELFHPQLEAKNFEDRNEQNPYNEGYNVGIFMGFGYTGYIGHTGGDPGVASMMFFDPETGIGRVLIVNTSFSGKQGNGTFYGIWDKLEKYQARLKNRIK